jgi:3-oxoacyl-(acyl-carrier-protein) synthase
VAVEDNHLIVSHLAARLGPWREPLAVTGLGMATAAGATKQACAAARASLSRFSALESELWDPDACELVPVTGAPIASVHGFSGVGRLAMLAADALSDVLSRDALDPVRTGLYAAVGSGWHFDARDERSGDEAEDDADQAEPSRGSQRSDAHEYVAAVSKELLPALRRLTSFVPARAQVYAGDAPGFILALEAARASLARGELDACLVGGVDSYLESEHLEALHALGVLKGPDSPSGLLPGEGAAFVLLETKAAARRRGARVAAMLGGAGIDQAGDAREDGFLRAWTLRSDRVAPMLG